MGRGKQWTDTETKALVEAFIHISEDAVVGTNQTSDQLYKRVADDAKQRYGGDWMRSADACKKRWIEVSKEVQRFCAAMKFVESVEHSGWNKDDYFKAAEEYYCKRHNVDAFKFVEEWNFLKVYEKWKTSTTTSPTSAKRPMPEEDNQETNETPRPLGSKKQKVIQAFESKTDHFVETISARNKLSEEQSEALLRMMEANIQQSEKNRESLQKVIETQTEKLTSELKKNAALKALVKMDLSTMSDEFQQKAKKKIEEEIGSTLDF